ncbi:MAG: BlaI/MecI/CopY family transcriptional regulator [Acidobacteria bacterium]|nr:BlaI/MecI/CopY family transcriptional regulator [Acidobacteriota bacterium]
MARKKQNTQRLLTEAELEIMNAVWKLGAASVRETMDALGAERKTAYTTVATFMKILENKGFLESRKVYGVLCYTPRVARESYESVSVRHLVKNVFQGEPSALVNRLLDDEGWSPEELRALRDRLRRLTEGE